MSEGTIPALVVGGGPVGLTMAAELSRHGVAARVIDRSPAPSDRSKALAVWSRTLELLDDMGIGADFVAAGRRAGGASLYGEGHRLVHLSFAWATTPHPYGLMLPQSETERLLAEHLARQGLGVERRVELVDLGADEHGVTAALLHPSGEKEILRCRWLLACDGAHSTVRHLLDVPFPGAAEPNDWFIADVHLRGAAPDDEVSLFLHEKGVLGVFPIGCDRFRIVADVGLARDLERAPDPTLEEIAALLAERCSFGWTPHDPVWLASFRIHERKVASYRHGRVFLAGDAAHVHSPAGGQGMNTGMQDAYNLAWKLGLVERGRGRELLLDSYQAERSPVGEIVLKRATALTRMATLRGSLAQQLRNRIVSLLGSLEIVQHALGDQFTELAIAYPSSPIQGEHGLSSSLQSWIRGRGVAPGERAPDAAVRVGEGGRPVTLFEVFRGTSHVLLLLEGTGEHPATDALARIGSRVREEYGDLVTEHLVLGPDPRESRPDWPGSILADAAGELHERYGAAAPTVYLIRPDGYVGFRSQPADEDSLLEHLGRYLVPRA
jgi:2-polyprenyl-6-methoxyphenol hydroxylase-like FAD-dependent oxidoreductase